MREFAAKKRFNVVLGVVDADLYAAGLNYVFGEAFITWNGGVDFALAP